MAITLKAQPEAKLREKAARDGQDLDTLGDILLDMAMEWEVQEHAEAIEGIKRG